MIPNIHDFIEQQKDNVSTTRSISHVGLHQLMYRGDNCFGAVIDHTQINEINRLCFVNRADFETTLYAIIFISDNGEWDGQEIRLRKWKYHYSIKDSNFECLILHTVQSVKDFLKHFNLTSHYIQYQLIENR